MKIKSIIITIIIIIYVLSAIGLYIGMALDEKNPCRGGRDTVAEFGETCDYAILSGSGDVLFNSEKQQTIETNVIGYIEINPFVYTIGDRGYTKLNYETGEIIQESSLELFEEKDKKIFAKLNKIPNFTIIGKYTCSNEYWKDDFFIQNPEKVPYIIFENNNNCSILVNYLDGLENVKCSYIMEKDTIKVKAYIEGTLFDGTYDDGRPYMEDEYIFDVIDNNHIVIDKGFYTVSARDSFIKK